MRPTVTHLRLRRLLYLFTVGRYGALPQESGDRVLSNNPWSSGLRCFSGSGWKTLDSATLPAFPASSEYLRSAPTSSREGACGSISFSSRAPSRHQCFLGRLTG